MGMRFDVHGPVGALVRRTAAHPRLSAVTGRVMPVLDRAAARLTGGRFLPSSLLVPTMLLTTTGAKSGLQRQTPLATLPDGAAFYVVGSNFGGGTHPGWSANLLATPQASVLYAGRTRAVQARLLEETEKAQVWPRLRQVWPSYDDYVARSGRDLRVFRLEPQE